MTQKEIPPGEDIYSRFADEPLAAIPEGAKGQMSFRTTTEIAAERARERVRRVRRFPCITRVLKILHNGGFR